MRDLYGGLMTVKIQPIVKTQTSQPTFQDYRENVTVDLQGTKKYQTNVECMSILALPLSSAT